MWRGLIAAMTIAIPGAASADPIALSGHGGPVMAVDVGDDGRIVTASFDNAVGLWSGGEPSWLDGHEAAVNTVLIDGNLIASAGDDFDVIVWNDGQPTRRTGHRGKVASLALSPDGRLLASASWDGTIGLWLLSGAAPRFLVGHRAGVNDVVFGPDGTLFSAGADGTIRAWDTQSGAELRQLTNHGFGVNRLALGPGWLAYGAVDGGTRLISPLTGEGLADFTADRRPILALDYAPETALLAVGDGEGFIMVIDTATRTVRHDFQAAARGPVWALAFSPDGATLYAGGLDPTVYGWQIDALDDAQTPDAADTGYLTDPDLMENGERQFMRKCSICHTLTPDSARRAGPTLHGIFGRPAGTVPQYIYSDRLDGSDIVWNAETIDALFDKGPDHYIPGSKMPMQVIAKQKDRADLIAFLRTATDPKETTE